jgi:hypothetical protein
MTRMDLPEIPDELWAAAEIEAEEKFGVKAAWPHLYALALRDAALRLREIRGGGGFGAILNVDECAGILSAWADASVPVAEG